MKISAVIPTLNEGTILRETLKGLEKEVNLDLIVVDGGSHDETVPIAKEFTKKVFHSIPGRAKQMNEGARHAAGDILLFLHADSRISDGSIARIIPALTRLGAVGGAFQLAFDTRNIFLQFVAWLANLRTRITRIPYGDQGIFILKDTFQQIGGFPDMPIMEDVALAVSMKKAGTIALLKDKIFTSPRRWEREGILFTTLRNRVLMLGYNLGVSPQRLAGWYRSIRQ